METCVICNGNLSNGEATAVLRIKGAESLKEAGGGEIKFEAGQSVHVKCRRDFCRDASRRGESMTELSDGPSGSGISRRSTKPQFRWNEHCLFCGGSAKFDGKKRGFEVIPVRTIDFQDSIAEVCQERNDTWAETVLGRLEFANDLHAADAVYHQQCSVNFRTGKQVPLQYFSTTSPHTDGQPAKRARQSGRPSDATRTTAFVKVTQFLEDNDEEVLTVNDLCEKMNEYLEGSGDEAYSALYMKRKLEEHFGDKIIVTTIKKKANVVTFKRSAASIINEFYCTPKKNDFDADKLRIIKTAAHLIKSDIKNLNVAGEFYPINEDMASVEQAMEFVPDLLRIFLRTILTGKNIDLKLASIGQAIIQGARPRVILAPLQLGLGVQMHHHFSSKFLIDTLYSHGFCSSYTAVQNFERSAAVTQGTDIPGFMPGCFIQHVADNVDHNIRTLDGLGTFHGMGIIATITPGTMSSRPVPKKSVTKEEIAAAGKIDIRNYKGPVQDASPLLYKELKDLKIQDSTTNLDLLYKLTMPLIRSPWPAWSGTMQIVFEQGNHPGKSSVLFLPMIDMDPGDLNCIYSTLGFIADQATRYGVTPIVTFDQPLWWKALMITLNEPQDSAIKSIVLRLGGLHIEMSYLGCIGHIMA